VAVARPLKRTGAAARLPAAVRVPAVARLPAVEVSSAAAGTQTALRLGSRRRVPRSLAAEALLPGAARARAVWPQPGMGEPAAEARPARSGATVPGTAAGRGPARWAWPRCRLQVEAAGARRGPLGTEMPVWMAPAEAQLRAAGRRAGSVHRPGAARAGWELAGAPGAGSVARAAQPGRGLAAGSQVRRQGPRVSARSPVAHPAGSPDPS
jgi:hypothetical protein